MGSPTGNNSIRKPRAWDNLGNNFSILEREGNYVFEQTIVSIPPHFKYESYASWTKDNDVSFNEETSEFILYTQVFPVPDSFVIKLPRNFSDLGSFPVADRNYGDSQYTVLTMREKTSEALVRFLPFIPQITINSIKFTLDIPEAFPIAGQIREIHRQSFSVPTKFSVWNVTPFVYEPLMFPYKSEHVVVERVWDGIGDCSEVSQEIDPRNLDASTQGKYFVNYKEEGIIVYPRYHYSGAFYEYSVGAELLTSPENEQLDMKSVVNVPPSPYTFRAYFAFDARPLTVGKINLTGNFEIKFILPESSEIYYPPNSNFTVGVEDKRPFAVFVYNAPETILPETWSIQYELVPLRVFFWIAVISLVILLVFLGAILWVPYSKTAFLVEVVLVGALIPLSLTPLVSTFIGLGGTTLLFMLLFAANIIAFGIIVITCFWKHSAQTDKLKRKRGK